jgi:anti-sigma regulatory factor (Ser/Thr protein kinase)
MVSLEDLIRSMCAGDVETPIRNYMSTNVLTVNSYDPVIEAMKMFDKSRVGRFPVVDINRKLVGMITKGDLTRGILIALEKDYRAEEVRKYRASHLFEDITSDRTSLIMRYNIKHFDFTNGGNASSNIKRALLRLGASPQIARRCGIAVYEAEINLIAHTTNGGLIRVQIEPKLIYIKVTDEGPGIPDVDQAKRPGYSTATPQVREKGFGAGMGLFNISRCVDRMELESTMGVGTTLEMFIYLQPKESFRESISLKED